MEELKYLLSYVWIAPWRDATAGVLWCVWLGVVLATVSAWYRRATLGRALTALAEAGAASPETAKTAADLGLTGPARRALKARDRLVCREGEGFYLPEEAAKKAEAVRRIGPGAVWQIPLTALGAYAVLVAAWYIIPLF